MSMKHFVGEHITTSLLEKDSGEPFIRIAKETDPDHFMDFDVEEWSELVNVIHMIDAARKFIPAVPHIIGMLPGMPGMPEMDDPDE